MTHRWLGLLLPVVLVAAGCSQSGMSTSTSTSTSTDHVHEAPTAEVAQLLIAQGRPDAHVAGPQGADPQFLVRCDVSHLAPDDPIIHPGAPGASHLHVFFGNTEVHAGSTYGDLQGQRSSCEQPLDTASYWVPALLRDGQVVESTGAIAYYRAGVGMDPRTLVPYPPGLMMIAGDPSATGPQPTEIVAWTCGASMLRSPEPPTCPERAPLRQVITFPDCWDGDRIDAPHHREHVAYSAGGSCPASHPEHIPQLTFFVSYPIWGDASDVLLASGSVHTLHSDFWNVWDQDKLTREVEICLHRLAVCDVAS